MESYYFNRCYDFKHEMISKICALLKDKQVDMSKYNIDVVYIERHCGEVDQGTLEFISDEGFTINGELGRWSEVIVEDLCRILDLLENNNK